MQLRQLLGRDAATEVWLPWLEEISSNFMNWPSTSTIHQAAAGAEPSTSTILSDFPSDKARPVKIHQRKSTHGSIPKEGLADESSMPPPSAEATPSQAKMASTIPGSL